MEEEKVKKSIFRFVIGALVWTNILSFSSHTQLKASALTVDQLYAKAYNSTISCMNLRTQSSINLARADISALQQAGVTWAVGEFSKQVDQVQHPFLVRIVQAINLADSTTTQININAAKVAVDPELPAEWRNSYSSAVDIIQQRLMQRLVEAINNANTTKSQLDIDAAVGLIKELKTASDASIVNWTITMQGQLSRTPALISSRDEFKNIIRIALENFEDRISFKVSNYSESTYNPDIINSIINENPLINYGFSSADIKLTWWDDESTRDFTIIFNYKKTKEEMIMMKNASEKKALEIINLIITSGMSELQKERAIHDYIVNKARYDNANFLRGTVPVESYTDYGVLINGTAVCDGYAKAMYRLLNMAGVKTLYVTGTAGTGGSFIGHAWNIVQINDKYYHVDATWDDPVTTSGKDVLIYDYFNISDEQMAKDHQWDRSMFPQAR
jgi:hypothetical protein